MAEILFQGHGSFRMTTTNGTVIYVDPFAGEGYDKKADVILVTHQHSDHNQIQLVPQKEDCIIIDNQKALLNGQYQTFQIKGIEIRSVAAYNQNHKKEDCVGYLVGADEKKIYFLGDTSYIEEMKNLKEEHIDVAFYPIDGIYNMNPAQASECADIIGAKLSVPVHMLPGKLFDEKRASMFHAKTAYIVPAGETLSLP